MGCNYSFHIGFMYVMKLVCALKVSNSITCLSGLITVLFTIMWKLCYYYCYWCCYYYYYYYYYYYIYHIPKILFPTSTTIMNNCFCKCFNFLRILALCSSTSLLFREIMQISVNCSSHVARDAAKYMSVCPHQFNSQSIAAISKAFSTGGHHKLLLIHIYAN